MNKRQSLSEFALFIREFTLHPIQMGAILPSSKQLVKQMIQCIPPETQGLIVELGAGTGTITEDLAKQPYAKQVIAIETSEKLSQHLKKRLPAITVYQGDAQEATQLLKDYTTPVQVIISGLPLSGFKAQTVARINQETNRLLAPGGIVIQYTYRLWGQGRIKLPHARAIAQHRVWKNIPPARIIVLQKPA
jgi:phosphatidylethanolamine/phosphatidyl-N-methylethanolamine N-methyltransferase